MINRPPSNEDLNRLPTEEELNRLQLTTLQYYLHETNPATGLMRDKTDPDAPASIAAVGLGLASIPILVERGVIAREFAPEIALRPLRFFRDSPQGPEPDATGYRGFYYHFLDMKTGRRVWQCELSTIDSAFLFAGMLTCAAYFDADTEEEAEVRRLADELYRRADWQWALNGGAAVSHGWRPETGFLPHTWTGYDEALLRLPARPRLADVPAAARELRRLLLDLPVEGDLRPRGPLLRAAVHAPALAPLDRLPRHPGRVHAGARQRLLREQPPGDVRPPGVRAAQPARVRRLRRALLGHHGDRRPRLGDAAGERHRAAVLRLPRARSALRSRRRNAGAVGGGRLAPVRAGDRDPDHSRHDAARPRRDHAIRLQAVVQPDVRGAGQPDGLVGHPLSLRHRPGSGDPHDRELPHRFDLGDHAPLPLRDGRVCAARASRAAGSEARSCEAFVLA